MMHKEWYTVRDASRRLGVNRQRVYQLINKGRLIAVCPIDRKPPEGGRPFDVLRVSRDSIDSYRDSDRKPGPKGVSMRRMWMGVREFAYQK